MALNHLQDLLFQLPSWDTVTFASSSTCPYVLSTPFLGYVETLGHNRNAGYTFNSLLGIPASGTLPCRSPSTGFQLPSWDTRQRGQRTSSTRTFNSLLGIQEIVETLLEEGLFQLPSWDTLPPRGSPDILSPLSTPFLGYLIMARLGFGLDMLSTPFLGYHSGPGSWSGNYQLFQLPSWDTGEGKPLHLHPVFLFQLPSWDTSVMPNAYKDN